MSVGNRDTNVAESAVAMGQRLGLEVVPVGNVQRAFSLFTDNKFAYPAAPTFVLPASVQQVAQTQTNDRLTLVGDRLAQLPLGQPVAPIVDLLAIAQDAARGGDAATAYGVGMQALNMANREVASVTAQTEIDRTGTAGATKWLNSWVQDAQARNEKRLAEGTKLGASLGYEQQMTLPNALSWLVYNAAILQAVQDQLDAGPLDEARIDRFARVLADVDGALDVYYPNQLAIIQAAPARPSPGNEVMATYLAEYTTFLVRAGQAQQNYMQQVIMRGQDPAALVQQNDVGLLLPTVLNLSSSVSAIPLAPDSITDELRQATTAITYYIATTSLIAAIQDFGMDQFGIGADPTQVSQPEVMQASVTTAKLAVDEVSALLGQRGLDASLPKWAADYGTAAVDALNDTPQLAAAKVLALNELYFDAITVFMLQSGPVQ